MPTNPSWLTWVQTLQAIAQSGLTYCDNIYDIERYHQLRGVAAEILATYTQVDLPAAQGLLESQSGYATPKLDTRGVIFRGDKVLLVKELADQGRWTFPGGWVDVNESPSRSVEREVFEETGYEVRAVKLLAVFDRNLHGHPPITFHTWKLFFRCELTGGAPADSHETAGASFFALDELPELSIMRTSIDEIERMFAHLKDPDRPTDFDEPELPVSHREV